MQPTRKTARLIGSGANQSMNPSRSAIPADVRIAMPLAHRQTSLHASVVSNKITFIGLESATLLGVAVRTRRCEWRQKSLCRSKSGGGWKRGHRRVASVRLRERARIVMAAEGMMNKEIAAELQVDANKVGRWRARVAKEGTSSIEKERPRGANHGGKNTKKQAQLRSEVIRRRHRRHRTTPPIGRAGRWHGI